MTSLTSSTSSFQKSPRIILDNVIESETKELELRQANLNEKTEAELKARKRALAVDAFYLSKQDHSLSSNDKDRSLDQKIKGLQEKEPFYTPLSPMSGLIMSRSPSRLSPMSMFPMSKGEDKELLPINVDAKGQQEKESFHTPLSPLSMFPMSRSQTPLSPMSMSPMSKGEHKKLLPINFEDDDENEALAAKEALKFLRGKKSPSPDLSISIKDRDSSLDQKIKGQQDKEPFRTPISKWNEKPLLQIKSAADSEPSLTEYDKYLSIKSFKHKGLNDSSSKEIEKKKIIKLKTDFIIESVKLITKGKYVKGYLTDYLDKPRAEQEKEVEFAFAALTSAWPDVNGNITKKDFLKILEGVCTNLVEPLDEINLRDPQKSLPALRNKINEIANSLNTIHKNDKMFEVKTIPDLIDRVNDLEHVSTLLYILNEEVQNQSYKIGNLENENVANLIITDQLGNEIKDKDKKITQLNSRVDALQKEILKVKAVNQDQAQIIQELQKNQKEFQEYRLEALQDQKRQRELLESLLKMQMEAEKKEQTAK